MNGLFTDTFIYSDDITIIAPSCYALNSMLNVCEEYALSHDILFNSLKTKYMFYNRNSINLNPGHIIIWGTFGVRQVTYAIKMKYFTIKTNSLFSKQNE